MTQMPPMPQGPQSPYVERDMTNAMIKASHRALTKLMTTQVHVFTNHVVAQANIGVGPHPNASTPVSRIRDIMRISPPTFHGTKVDDHPHGFIDEVFEVVDPMGFTPTEKSKSTSFQLKDVAQVWFEQ